MIIITDKFRIKCQHAQDWPAIAADFTAATRLDPGCLWFDCSRNIENLEEYVLIQTFREDEVSATRVNSEHFKQARVTLPPYVVSPR
ncbi:putative quinol monooxygenase [Streptomyces brasiliensis]|uniref:Antibiotic biosynthesis monooxygenase n=1 Tax=Streptomyces brasiliensis TaxID=1954 RepID=A0A917UP41_9ACTN|nr:putative quinol monooxygenase [Streptomyces brasiliensis]GGJ71136.1 antibiotic biosynthesis monooxygenase [Streptomyces brasiliensis]